MKKLTEQEVQEKIDSNEMISYAVSELEEIFKTKFYLSEKELKEVIVDVVSRTDEDIIIGLTDIFQKFVDNEINGVSKNERRVLAKRTISNCLDLYNMEKQEILNDFFKMIAEAKKYNIDPFKLAIKGNLRNASPEKFYSSLNALVEKEYVDLNTNEKFTLFDKQDVKDLFERCASFACGLNEEDVQNVLDVLANFVFDEETGNYYVHPRELVKKVNFLLKTSPKRLEENIDFLTGSFVPNLMSKKDLVMRVSESPSILLCSPEKIVSFEDKLSKCVDIIIEDENFTEKIDDKKKYARDYAHNFCYDLDNFNLINSINENGFKNIEEISKILIKNLGANNALKCLKKVEVLSCDPSTLDCFLTKLAVDEKKYDFDFRAFFIQNTNLCLNLMEDEESLQDVVTGTKTNRRKREQEVADKGALPTISDDAYEKKYQSLSAKKKKDVDELSGNILENIQKRKEKRKLSREEKKQEKLQEEYKHIDEIKAKLNEKEYSSEYVRILSKIKAFLDDKYGEGYAQKTYSIDDYIKSYNALKDVNDEYNKIIAFTDEVSKILETNADGGAILPVIKIVDTNVNTEVLKRQILEFDATLTPVLKKLETLQNMSIDAFKSNMKLFEKILQLDDKIGLKTKDGFYKKFQEGFVIDEILNNGIYLRYLEMMKKVVDKEFKETTDTILPTYEIDALLEIEIVTKDKFRSLGAVYALSNIIYNIYQTSYENMAKLIEQEDKRRKSTNEDGSFDKVLMNNLDGYLQDSKDRQNYIKIASTLLNWGKKIENFSKSTSVFNRFRKLLKGMDFNIDENGAISLETKIPKFDEEGYPTNERNENLLTNKKCLFLCSQKAKSKKNSGKDDK